MRKHPGELARLSSTERSVSGNGEVLEQLDKVSESGSRKPEEGKRKHPMDNESELLINPVNLEEPKRLRGSSQNGKWVDAVLCIQCIGKLYTHRGIGRP